MKKIFIFFIIFKTFFSKELTIFYSTNFYNNYEPISLDNEIRGGVAALQAKLKELKLKYPYSLNIHLGSNQIINNEDNFIKYQQILKHFKFDTINVDINLAKNKVKSLPLISCNIYEASEKFITKFNKYKNFYIDNIKISIIGLSDPTLEKASTFEEESNEIKVKNPLIEIKKNIELIKRNFNPHIIIVISNFSSSEFTTLLEKYPNIILIMEIPEKIKNLEKINNKYIIGKKLKEHELGKIELKMENNEIIDYKVDIIPIIIKKEEYIENKDVSSKINERNDKEAVIEDKDIKALLQDL